MKLTKANALPEIRAIAAELTDPALKERLLAAADALETRKRPKRPPAALNPIQFICREGLSALRIKLNEFNHDQLRVIIAEFGMDGSQRFRTWKDKQRLIDLIATIADKRSTKGDAFMDFKRRKVDGRELFAE